MSDTTNLQALHNTLEDMEQQLLTIRRDIKDSELDSREGIRTDLAVALTALAQMRARVILLAFDNGEIQF